MSHTIHASLNIKHHKHLIAACADLNYKVEERVSHRMFDGKTVQGTRITIPGWRERVMVDMQGKVHYDHYNGQWGNLADLDHLAQKYSMKVEAEVAENMGALVDYETLPNGDIKMVATLPNTDEVEVGLWDDSPS